MIQPGTVHLPAGLAVLLAVIAGERLLELVVAHRHARWATARGGTEYGRGHYPVMVVLHVGLLLGTLAEAVLGHHAFVPALGWPALSAVIVANLGRWWCIRSLGPQWNTRVIIVPNLALVSRGPYRWMRHPNYVFVIMEGLALPLVYGAWLTALLFTAANAALLTVRLRVENEALQLAA
ncbi:isoprenylcysteine carboxyl methyltransferase family protein [Streptomyces sp. NPDC127190]|uniref:isoprenylcysteine carboxyl methyltransferase family protein n=1 Tax=unclassified Streptomyces TaxID=2593676 RepID=UPI0036413595